MELMIAVFIIALLASIAYPNYQEYLRKSRRVDAQGALISFATAMERHYTLHNSYLGTAQGVVPSAPIASLFPSQAPTDGGSKSYDLTIEALSSGSFTLRATPVKAQQGDGYLELLSTGARRWDRDNSGAISAGEQCWEGTCS